MAAKTVVDSDINYQVLLNKVVSFTIGQDYSLKSPNTQLSRSFTEKNLLIALNLALGFGSKRPVIN